MSTELEKQIAEAARVAVIKSVADTLTDGYQNPLKELVASVVAARADSLSAIVGRGLDAVLDSGDFADAVEEAIRSKLARTLVGQLGGEIEQRINDLKSRPDTRARLTLALGKMIDEFAKEPSR